MQVKEDLIAEVTDHSGLATLRARIIDAGILPGERAIVRIPGVTSVMSAPGRATLFFNNIGEVVVLEKSGKVMPGTNCPVKVLIQNTKIGQIGVHMLDSFDVVVGRSEILLTTREDGTSVVRTKGFGIL